MPPTHSQGYIRLGAAEDEQHLGNQRSLARLHIRRILFAFALIVALIFGYQFFRSPTDMHIDYKKYDIPHGVAPEQIASRKDWLPHHTSGHRYRYASQTNFTLPLSSTNLFIIKTASAGGKLDVITSPSQPRDSVGVGLVLSYDREDIFEHILALRLSRPGGENGVGFFEERDWRDRDHSDRSPELDITLVLPESTSQTPYTIRKLETNVSNMSQNIVDLRGRFNFNSISLSSSNGHIDAKHLDVETGSLKTSQGGIRGTFRAKDALILHTSNGPIDVDVQLENANDGKETLLDAKTSNAPFRANVTMTSTKNREGIFRVNGKTSNSMLNIAIPKAPVDFKLGMEATTSNGRADIDLPPTFEGEGILKTSAHSTASVVERHGVEDPTGRGRQRHVKTVGAKTGKLQLKAFWGESEGGKGDVTVKTSQGDIVVRV
ncbi:hypothetical protein D9613_001049 [Agrocybe pediades]|uniref:Uncharacterized protein n=1 Tax=Agrocybe pediades TaxID=84607 RepID=A0A8H4R1I6_9AGAR|nr:hypothetical protein D9613_001049 [Agrocybe pediades]